MEFSCAEYTFPLLERRQRFALVRLLGFESVDIGLFERTPDLCPHFMVENPEDFVHQLQSDLAVSGLRVADVFLQTGVDPHLAAANDPVDEVRARNRTTFLEALHLCRDIRCTHLTGLPGVWHDAVQREQDWAVAVEEAHWRVETAAAAGVCYAVEAHVGSLCPDVASAREFLGAVPGLTLTLDYGHFVYAGTPSEEVHSLLPFASHLHVRGGAAGRLQTVLQENEIDFAGALRRLAERQYRGSVALEYVWTDWQQCNRTDNVSETLLLRNRLQRYLGTDSARSDAIKENAHV